MITTGIHTNVTVCEVWRSVELGVKDVYEGVEVVSAGCECVVYGVNVRNYVFFCEGCYMRGVGNGVCKVRSVESEVVAVRLKLARGWLNFIHRTNNNLAWAEFAKICLNR